MTSVISAFPCSASLQTIFTLVFIVVTVWFRVEAAHGYGWYQKPEGVASTGFGTGSTVYPKTRVKTENDKNIKYTH